MEQIEESIERYLAAMDTADRTQSEVAEAKTSRLKDKIAKLKQQMQDLKAMEQRLHEAPDGQVSLTDPDARSMATSGRGTGMVGYNVQSAVDDKHHLIVAHEVTNVGHDRSALATMAEQARRLPESKISMSSPIVATSAGTDLGLRASRHHSLCAQAADLRQQG